MFPPAPGQTYGHLKHHSYMHGVHGMQLTFTKESPNKQNTIFGCRSFSFRNYPKFVVAKEKRINFPVFVFLEKMMFSSVHYTIWTEIY